MNAMSSRDAYEFGFDEAAGKTINADICPECEGRLLTEAGEICCTDCGLIVNEYRLDHASGSSLFSDDERTGAPLTPSRHDRGLSTEIGYGSDAKGNPLSGRKRRQLGRLRREHNRAKWGSKAGRNLGEGFTEIARITDALSLPRSVRNRASMLFRRAQDQDLLLGRSIEGMAAASVYAACRCNEFLRTVDEIADVARCERSKILTAYRVLNAEMGLETKPRTPMAFVPRFASELNVPDRVRVRARELVALAEEAEIGNGCNPAGVAAAGLYLAGKDYNWPLTQAKIAGVANVSEVTLRTRYNELREECGADD
jgi:transcription initiation factor TFIIB